MATETLFEVMIPTSKPPHLPSWTSSPEEEATGSDILKPFYVIIVGSGHRTVHRLVPVFRFFYKKNCENSEC